MDEHILNMQKINKGEKKEKHEYNSRVVSGKIAENIHMFGALSASNTGNQSKSKYTGDYTDAGEGIYGVM